MQQTLSQILQLVHFLSNTLKLKKHWACQSPLVADSQAKNFLFTNGEIHDSALAQYDIKDTRIQSLISDSEAWIEAFSPCIEKHFSHADFNLCDPD